MIDLFPGVISRPVTVREAFLDVDDIGFELTHTAKKIVSSMKQGDNGKMYAKQCGHEFVRLSWNRPSPTLIKNFRLSGAMGLVHPSENRHIGLNEAKRIGSFPGKFSLPKSAKAKQWNRIGNSVPPLLMRAIAAQIRHKLWNGDPLTRYPKTMTYPEILEAAWQEHLAPRDPDAPTVISTFAGGGGSSLGYSMAGYRELLAVEWDNNAVETFKLNFPDVPVYHGDIAKLSVEECMKLAGLSEPGEIDLFDGSPPCQGFSTAGKRVLNDPRNELFREYVRLLCGLKPKVFVMENVPGLVKGKMKLVFAEIMRELKASGYQVRCKKLNAMYFYVPQSRERLIFIGVRDDLGVEASYPEVESRPVTVGKALVNTPNNGINGNFLTLEGKTSKLIKKLRPGQRLKQLYEQIHGKGNKAYFAFSRTHRDMPSRTIAKDSAGLFHYKEDRTLTIGEYKRVASFPDRFILLGSFSTALLRLGNSVPPLLMRAIAKHIKINVLTGITPELIK